MLGAGATRCGNFFGATVLVYWLNNCHDYALLLASTGGHMTSSLVRMILNALFTACHSNFIITIAANAEGMMFRSFNHVGSFGTKLETWAFPLYTSSCIFLTQFRSLNVLLMGDEAASTLGQYHPCRWAYLTISALMVGTLVSSVEPSVLLVLSSRILRARLLGPITEGWFQLRWYLELSLPSGQMPAFVPS